MALMGSSRIRVRSDVFNHCCTTNGIVKEFFFKKKYKIYTYNFLMENWVHNEKNTTL